MTESTDAKPGAIKSAFKPEPISLPLLYEKYIRTKPFMCRLNKKLPGIFSIYAITLLYFFTLNDVANSQSATPPSNYAATLDQTFDLTGSGVSISMSGADPSGSIDSTSVINDLLALVGKAGGGLVTLPPNSLYLINAADLVVPAGIRLVGATSPLPGGAYTTRRGSGFLLNPSHTILLGQGAQLNNVAIIRSTLLPNPTANQALEAVAQWGTEQSVAVTIPPNIGGQDLSDLFIIGFNTAIKANAGQFSIERVVGDDFNGLEVTTAGDNHYIDDVRFEPFYSMATAAASGSWARPGIAFNLHDGNTGTVLTRVFSFMYSQGLLLNETGVAQVANSGFEWASSIGNGITGTIGVRWINHNAQTSVSQTYSNGFDIAYSDEGPGEVMINSPSTVAKTKHFNLLGQLASQKIAFAGNPTAGQDVTLTIENTGVSKPVRRVTYRVSPNDSLNSIASALAKVIYQNPLLVAESISAHASNNAITIYWPVETPHKVSISAQDLIFSADDAKTELGSYGMISSANVNDAENSEVFYIGPHTNGWTITTPFISNGTPMPTTYNIDPTSISAVHVIPLLSFSSCSSEIAKASISCGILKMSSAPQADGLSRLTRRTIAAGSNDSALTTDVLIAWNSRDMSTKIEHLPTCTAAIDRMLYIIKDETGTANKYPITVHATRGIIDGGKSYTIKKAYGSVTVICDGTTANWMVI